MAGAGDGGAMDDLTRAGGIQAYWGREGLEGAILAALAAAGKNLDALTVEDLAPADQFHGGGKAATDRLAGLAGVGQTAANQLGVGGQNSANTMASLLAQLGQAQVDPGEWPSLTTTRQRAPPSSTVSPATMRRYRAGMGET